MSIPDISALLRKKTGDFQSKHQQPKSFFHGDDASAMTALHPENIVIFFPQGDLSVYPARVHHRFALNFALGCDITMSVDNEKFYLNPGNGMLIFPFQAHGMLSGPGAERSSQMLVTFSMSGDTGVCLRPLRNRVFELSGGDADLLAETAAVGLGETGLNRSEAVYMLGRFLFRKLSELPESSRAAFTGDDTLSLYFQAVGYIKDNLFRRISIKDITERFNVSERHLRRVFKRHTGNLTLGRLINSTRIKTSFEFLMRTDMSIAEIAARCGFSDQFAFSRAFKRMSRVSPSEYRARWSASQAGDGK